MAEDAASGSAPSPVEEFQHKHKKTYEKFSDYAREYKREGKVTDVDGVRTLLSQLEDIQEGMARTAALAARNLGPEERQKLATEIETAASNTRNVSSFLWTIDRTGPSNPTGKTDSEAPSKHGN